MSFSPNLLRGLCFQSLTGLFHRTGPSGTDSVGIPNDSGMALRVNRASPAVPHISATPLATTATAIALTFLAGSGSSVCDSYFSGVRFGNLHNKR